MGEVVELDVQTTLAVPSERLLQKAIDGAVTNVVIIGYDPEGELWFASSDADCRAVLWLMERAKKLLLDAH